MLVVTIVGDDAVEVGLAGDPVAVFSELKIGVKGALKVSWPIGMAVGGIKTLKANTPDGIPSVLDTVATLLPFNTDTTAPGASGGTTDIVTTVDKLDDGIEIGGRADCVGNVAIVTPLGTDTGTPGAMGGTTGVVTTVDRPKDGLENGGRADSVGSIVIVSTFGTDNGTPGARGGTTDAMTVSDELVDGVEIGGRGETTGIESRENSDTTVGTDTTEITDAVIYDRLRFELAVELGCKI